MTRHIDILSKAWVAYAALILAITGGTGLLVAGLGFLDTEAMPVLLVTALFTWGLGVLFAAPMAAVGIGLARRLPWARVGAIIASAFVVGSAPFGTALGVYSWVTLLDDEVVAAFAPVA